MANVCPTCGHVNRDGARFCSGCGGKLALPAQPPAKPTAEAAEKIKEAASKAGEILGPAAAQAGPECQSEHHHSLAPFHRKG